MLNSEQQRAVDAVRGPVCILAGAGSGKTTTITHRVANQVESRAFRGDEILAVSFTDKAAGEMRARLDGLGVSGVRCSTFHSALRFPRSLVQHCSSAFRRTTSCSVTGIQSAIVCSRFGIV